jgi:outer membrane immunogenic protein
MEHIVKTKLIIAIAIAGASPAIAADMPLKAAPFAAARPIYDWTGFYLGINGGGGQSRNCWDMNGAFIVGFNPPLAEGCNNATGAVAGGQVGYRYQTNNFVFGIEAQGDWANLKGSNQSAVSNSINALIKPASISLTNTSTVSAIGLFTGAIGYSFGPVLWSVKGGAAVTDNQYDGSLSLSIPQQVRLLAPVQKLPNPLLTDTASEIKFGGVIGTELDWMFAPGWSIGVDYNHLFMGSRNVGFALTNAPLAKTTVGGTTVGLLGAGSPSRNDRISQDVDMATLRINYTFSAGR